MTIERAWKHFSRAVAKPFSGANIPNLQQLDLVVLAAELNGYRKVPAHVIKHGEFDFTWVEALTQAEYTEFRSEWLATLQAQAITLTVTTRAMAVSQLTPAIRNQLMADRNRSAMWTALQNTKDRYRTLAKSKVEGFFARQKKKLDELQTSLTDKIQRNPAFGLYLTYYAAATTSFEHGSVDGAETDEQRSLLAAGGLYNVLKNGYSVATNIGRVIVTAGADLSALKSVVQGGVSMLNSLGGLLAGIVDLASGRDADWRALSSRFGLDQSIDDLSKRLQGRSQEAFATQVTAGPQQLARGASLTEEDMVALRKQLRNSFYWVQVFEKDIEAIEKELKTSDLQRELNHVLTKLRSADDSSLVKPSQIQGIGTVEAVKKEELQRQLAEAKKKVGLFKAFMLGDLKKLDNMLAAVETRRGIAAAQRTAVEQGLQFDAARVIATAAASFDKSQLKHVEPAPATPSLLGQIRAFDKSRLRAAELRVLNPAPASVPENVGIADIIAKAAKATAAHPSAVTLLAAIQPTPVSEEWDTD